MGANVPPSTTATAVPTSAREAAMSAFLADSFINPENMEVEHITTPMALLLPNPAREIASSLLCKAYSPEDAAYIWSVLEPHFQLPPTHPWAEGTHAKDAILAMLQMVYTTPKMPPGISRPSQTLSRRLSRRRPSLSSHPLHRGKKKC